MKELLEFILKGIVGENKFEVDEIKEDSKVDLQIKSAPENVGLIIGKNGATIKALQNILRVRARLENVYVSVTVEEKK